MINTYRTFTDEKEVFYISDKTYTDYYCEFTWYEDNWFFDLVYLLNNSRPATLWEVIKYKITKWINEK